MEPHGGDQTPHVPGPSLWPVGFAIGIACVLLGIIVGWLIVAVGAAITLLFGFLWIREATTEYRGPAVAVEPERREAPARPAPALPAHEGGAAMPAPESEAEIDRFPRSRFLEGATLGLGAVIGGIVTVPALGFAVIPAFTGQEQEEVDLGPLDGFPEGQFVVATFLLDPVAGEVSRRTAYVRRNGTLNGQPSFTVLSNRCVHLGCPVQPNGPLDDEDAKEFTTEGGGEVRIIRTRPAGFGCPCHGGQYDVEGNRTAGPPVRALDRYEFSIRNGRLFLGNTYSVSKVDGQAQSAKIHRYRLAGPGEHVTGWSSWLYPVSPPS